jgi:DNA polymerase-3 subunit alpha
LGSYVTGHPLEKYKDEFKKYSTVTTEGLSAHEDGEEVLLGALVNKLKFTVTKKTGDRMAILTLEDLDGLVEALVFPKVFAECGHHLAQDAILYFKARLDKKEEEPKLLIQEIFTTKSIHNRMTRSVLIEFKPEFSSEKTLHDVQGLLSKFTGQTPVYLNFIKETGERSEVIIDRSLYVSPTPDFIEDVEQLLGSGSVHLQV